jgi:hypothetical protein
MISMHTRDSLKVLQVRGSLASKALALALAYLELLWDETFIEKLSAGDYLPWLVLRYDAIVVSVEIFRATA